MLALFRLSLALALVTVFVRAQSSWTAVSSPSRATLWGICHAAGQFVAVGENGTILTSPDGLAWTPRASGTTAWLTSVTHNLGHFLAVGDRGTVLRSSDAVTWENVSVAALNPPTSRLNVVIPWRNGFLIYGEQDSAYLFSFPNRFDSASREPRIGPWWRGAAFGLDSIVLGGETGLSILSSNLYLNPSGFTYPRITDVRNVSGVAFFRGAFTAVGADGGILTSADAINWSRQTSNTTANLQALAPFNNTLVAIGDAGTILSQDALGLWQRRTSPTSELLLGLAASDTTAVIVGGNGTILRATPTPLAPTLVTSPASVTETLGGAASFLVRANGSLPLSYQWHRNGTALAGETRDTLTRTPLTGADTGSYTVTVSNSAGSVTSPVATLNLLPAPAPIVDETFRADPALDGIVTALLALPDDSVLVATAGQQRGDGIACRLRKLRPDGRLDPTWTSSVLSVSDPNAFASIRTLTLQPDGKILVGGTFATHNNQPRPNLLRLQPDGTLDATFTAAPEAAARPILELILQPDGRILLANRGTVPLRLLPDGSSDPDFRPSPLPPAPILNSPIQRDRFVEHIALSRDKIYFSGMADLRITSVQGFLPDTMLVRLDAAGIVDPTFTTQQWSGLLLAFTALDDGTVVLVRDNRQGNINFNFDTFATRLTPTGSRFSGNPDPKINRSTNHIFYPDGRLLYFDPAVSGLVRLTPAGSPDSGFTGGIGQPTTIALATNDRLLVGGSFTLYNARPANRVARLHPVPNGTINPPRLLDLSADKLTVALGEPVTVRAAVTGSAELTYDWSVDSSAPIRTASPTFIFTPTRHNVGASTLRLTVRNPRGEATTAPLTFTILPAAPTITSQPARIATQSGRDVQVRVERNNDAGPTTAEWRHNGRLLAPTGERWADGQTLYLRAVTPAQAGSYTLTLRNQLGVTVTSAPILLTVDETSRLANLSTRAHVSPGRPLIAGFTLGGSERDHHQILIRGIGRGVARFGVTDALPDPQALLFRGQVEWNPGNRDWDGSAPEYTDTLRTAFASVGAFPLELGSKDAAALITLDPGSYTVHLTDQGVASGTALVELYEADNDAAPLINLSTRATVTPTAPVIAGFAIVGPVPKRVLLRAAGPALAALGVTDALSNPRLELKNESGATVALNDDWQSSTDASALAANSVGAFPFATASRDAALLITLAPGNYTAHLTSADTTSGSALIEIYDLPDSR